MITLSRNSKYVCILLFNKYGSLFSGQSGNQNEISVTKKMEYIVFLCVCDWPCSLSSPERACGQNSIDRYISWMKKTNTIDR